MKGDRISRTQLMALLWAGTLAPAAELLPGLLLPTAGKSAWLSVLAAAPLLLAAGGLLGRFAGSQGAARTLRAGLGPVLGRLVLLIYIMWGELLLALRLRLSAQRLLAAGYRDGSLWFFLVLLAGLVLWIGLGKLSAFARAGQLFLAALLVAAGVVLGLAAFQVRVERLLPLWWTDGPAVAMGAVPAAGVLSWGVFGVFLTGAVADQGERKGWHWTFWCLGGCALLAAAQAIVIGNLGVGLAGQLDDPFFALAKSVGVEGAFQRVESIIASVWCFSDLAIAGFLVFSLRAMAAELSECWRDSRWPAVAAVVSALILCALFRSGAETWNERIVPLGNLALCAISVVFLGIAAFLCGKKCGKKHMLWSKRGQKPQI